MLKIDGREIADKIIQRLKSQPTPKKILAAVLVDENPASISFLKQKEKIAKELGVDFRIYRFPSPPAGGFRNDNLRKEAGKIALLKRVDGVTIQLPLPVHLNRHYILNIIPREKDIDVLGERALAAFYTGQNPIFPPAVGVVKEILRTYNLQPTTLKTAVVGLGFLVGKPIATWLMGKCPEIYLLDQGSDFSILKNMDLVITGVGKPGLIKPEMLKENAIVIDFGCSVDKDEKISGDFDASSIENCKLSAGGGSAFGGKIENLWYTPTPGGTGPILVTKLFENFYTLAGV
jgi:5,10-methylene-tetrahydrofolate dehydrogenase/methenyl tetrahydrofolate cyclohydrolase